MIDVCICYGMYMSVQYEVCVWYVVCVHVCLWRVVCVCACVCASQRLLSVFQLTSPL